MLMKYYFIYIFFMLQSLVVNACLSANQYKIFPIGIKDTEIITLTAHINRYDSFDKNEEFKIPKIGWSIKYYIATYDLNGKLIFQDKTEKLIVESEHYNEELSKTYERKLKEIKLQNKNIQFFTPEYISFCDFQKKCNILTLKNNLKKEEDYLIYESEKHPISLNAFQEFKRSATFTDNLSAYYLSSIRVYKSNNIKVVIGHVGTGYETSMGWITNDPNKKPKDEYDVVILAQEHKPNFKFDQLSKTIYEEPLLHHGYGFDFLIIKETK